MNWFEKLLPSLRTQSKEKRGVPEGLWGKCEKCGAMLYRAELDRNLCVCPKCHAHDRIGARKRLQAFLDETDREPIGEAIVPVDRLKFRDQKKYKERLQAAQKNTGEKEAFIAYAGHLLGMPIVASAFEFDFMGGSMGAAVGERFVRAAEISLERHIPFVCFTASGGARMQEGMFSLWQMAKTSAVIHRLREQSVPYITVLTNPTMGGVSASLAMLGHIIIAEPGALIGFAGPRVIEQTVRETLPSEFQRSEFLLSHGAIDMVIDRREQRERIAKLLAKLVSTQRMPD